MGENSKASLPSKNKIQLIVIALGIIAVIVIVANLTGNDDSPKPARQNNTDSDAFYVCQQFVEKRLKAPSTAKFAWKSDSSIRHLSDGNYEVTSYVDSQNAFGATVRNNYFCVVKEAGNEKWNLIALNFNN